MESVIFTLAGLAFSAAGLFYLTQTNAKRRRAHGLAKTAKKPHNLLAWLWVFLPLPILILSGNMPALVMWMTALFIVGWGMACFKPTN